MWRLKFKAGIRIPGLFPKIKFNEYGSLFTLVRMLEPHSALYVCFDGWANYMSPDGREPEMVVTPVGDSLNGLASWMEDSEDDGVQHFADEKGEIAFAEGFQDPHVRWC